MSSPSQSRPADAPHLPDELAAQRRRHAARIPGQREVAVLSEPDREQYERRLDAYEVQAA